jgi:RHS repeat-associated protein
LLTISNPNTAVRSYTLGYTYNAGASTDRTNIRSIVENTTVAHPIGKQSWLYSYDGGDRLMSATATTLDAPNHASVGAYSWQYDKLDNATQANYPTYSDNPTYNSLNQQTKNAWWQNFTYDSAGNATKEANESNSTLRAYKYDMEGRLVEMTDPRNVGYKVTFTYDGMGRRILQATTSGGTTTYKRYLWCGSTLCQQRDTGTGVIRRYLATGEYVNAQGATPAKKYVYFQDHLGSVRDLVDASTGTRVGALDYTPYGQVRDSYGVLPDYRYAGLMWVGEVGLSASATRFYDGSTMRWMTRDWIREAGGINLYSYAGANPITHRDSRGTDIWTEAAGEGEMVLHQSVCIGNPSGGNQCFSYYINFNGAVLPDHNSGGEIIDYIKTSSEEDEIALRGIIGTAPIFNKRLYGIQEVCRTYSQKMFDIFASVFKKIPSAPPKRPVNPIKWGGEHVVAPIVSGSESIYRPRIEGENK